VYWLVHIVIVYWLVHIVIVYWLVHIVIVWHSEVYIREKQGTCVSFCTEILEFWVG